MGLLEHNSRKALTSGIVKGGMWKECNSPSPSFSNQMVKEKSVEKKEKEMEG